MAEESGLTSEAVLAKVADAKKMLQSGSNIRVLQDLLADPPASLKDNGPKEAWAEEAVRALVLIKEADMSKIIDQLSETELDSALKYTYWGLSAGQNAPILLKWHAALVEKCGVGAIMRVLAERRVADNKVLA